jgi:glycine betaine/proline transport system substrate-binding protein
MLKKNSKAWLLLTFSIVISAMLILTGCSAPEPTQTTASSPPDLTSPAADKLPGKGVKVQPVHNSILEELFQNEIVRLGLEELGYEVQPYLELDVTTMHVAVGQGDADYCANHWEPLQNQFYIETGGGVTTERVGALFEGAMQGYLIDKKTAEEHNITSIDQLKDPEIAKLFDSDGDGKANLAGCNPGWGCERTIEHHLDAYGLRDTIQHDQGTYFAVISDTITRYNAGKPILYYTWTPLWLSSILKPGVDTEWLVVPFTSLPEGESEDVPTLHPDGRNLGFSVNTIRIVVNKEFMDANPAAVKFFEQVSIPIEDINTQNLLMRDGEDSEAEITRHAEEWIKEHQTEFDKWIEEALKAGN